ncbi:hypothetical protein FYM84_26910 [Pseudomonas sp. CAH-1]|uniref:hypothetical protein n=1 Tax=Pseudomonas sp. CAH-1 TaxID=2605744 RepID=UPI0012AE2506|nr:hypothetical protein [Pseudomonas sp. CAH-1]MRT64165.1 hypothetical protein [Pseudomonas sp. CAH-1]
MSRNKKSSPTKYLKQSESKTQRKVVSTRVTVSTANAFSKAVEIAEKNGAHLSLQDVVETALREAIAEVNNAYDIDCWQFEFDLESEDEVNTES